MALEEFLLLALGLLAAWHLLKIEEKKLESERPERKKDEIPHRTPSL